MQLNEVVVNNHLIVNTASGDWWLWVGVETLAAGERSKERRLFTDIKLLENNVDGNLMLGWNWMPSGTKIITFPLMIVSATGLRRALTWEQQNVSGQRRHFHSLSSDGFNQSASQTSLGEESARVASACRSTLICWQSKGTMDSLHRFRNAELSHESASGNQPCVASPKATCVLGRCQPSAFLLPL